MTRLERGTEIACPNCKKIMLKAKFEIYSGTVIGPHTFQTVDFKDKKGARLECPFCKTDFHQVNGKDGRNKLHTKVGWR